jgi:hypothetical protein
VTWEGVRAMTKHTGAKGAKPAREAERRARLAELLRANLQKRKAQARARAAVERRSPPHDDKGQGGN